jgi:EmrB/QacA subfamily drug resistance transporter
MPKKRIVHKNIVLLIVAIAQFMVVLDTSIINVALPAIYESLRFTSASELQWVVSAYTLAFGGFLLLGGRAADLYGRRKVFLWAVAGFAAASLACGLAQNSLTLEITRAVQGLAAAFMSPAALSIIITTFKEGKERAKAFSVWGAVAAGGAATGVLLGGVLTQYLDWRWNFLVNIPVGIAVFALAYLYVPESKADLDHKKLDLPGAVSVTSGLILLVYAITKAPEYGWLSAQSMLLFVVSLSLLAFFIWNESRSKHALMPLSIFKVGTVAGANLTQLPITAAMFSMFFFVTLYVQNVLEFTPVQSGLGFLPITIVIGFMAVGMSKVIGKVGYKLPMVIAPLFMAAGLFYLAHVRVDGTYWQDVFPGLLLMSVGMGMVFVATTIAATTGVPHRESGLASGILNTSQQIGGALGLAVLSGVSASYAASYLRDHAATASLPLTQAAAQVSAFHHALYVGTGFALLASVFAFFFVKQLKTPGEGAAPAVHV